jgi:hypothetical protein
MPAIDEGFDAWENELKVLAKELEAHMRKPVFDGRSASLAITHLQTAVLWALESNRREVV